MDNKVKIRILINELYGQFNTKLEHEYETKLIDNLTDGNIDNIRAWLTYNQVILELKNTLKNSLKVSELQYKLTENTDPNNICIELIDGLHETNLELKRLSDKIRNF